jgi:hypothetical protein
MHQIIYHGEYNPAKRIEKDEIHAKSQEIKVFRFSP